MSEDLRQRAIVLYDRFTHEGGDRRAFMRDLGLLAGGAATADLLLSSIAANPASAAIVGADDRRIKAETARWDGGAGRAMTGYRVRPERSRGKLPAVMVIHENRGLTEHIRDVTRRVALLGYLAVAPDFLAPSAARRRARTRRGR